MLPSKTTVLGSQGDVFTSLVPSERMMKSQVLDPFLTFLRLMCLISLSFRYFRKFSYSSWSCSSASQLLTAFIVQKLESLELYEISSRSKISKNVLGAFTQPINDTNKIPISIFMPAIVSAVVKIAREVEIIPGGVSFFYTYKCLKIQTNSGSCSFDLAFFCHAGGNGGEFEILFKLIGKDADKGDIDEGTPLSTGGFHLCRFIFIFF